MSSPGFRKVGRVLFVVLRRCNITRWSSETKIAAFQLGLTRIGKVICLPDIPDNRDLLLRVYPWVAVTPKTTDEVKTMLNVPENISWQELRDNMPEPELNHASLAQMVAGRRSKFVRELSWLKDEMRERLQINFVKPMDALDPQEKSVTLFTFDDAAKEYWKVYIKDKMRADRRFARFTPNPKHGFQNPSTAEAMGMFFPKTGRGDIGTSMYYHFRPMMGTPATRFTGRTDGLPLIKLYNQNTDRMTAGGIRAFSFQHY